MGAGLVLAAVMTCLTSTGASAQADCSRIEDLVQRRQLDAAAAQTVEPGAGVCAHAVAKAFLRAGNRERAQELINRAARFADPLQQPWQTAEILIMRVELEAAPEILREDLDQLKRLDPAKRDELIAKMSAPIKAAIDAYLKAPLPNRCPSRELKSAWAPYLDYQAERLEQICGLAAELQRFRSEGATRLEQVGVAADNLAKVRELLAAIGAAPTANAAQIEARIAAWRSYFGKVDQANRETGPATKLALLREAARIAQQRLDAQDPVQAAQAADELARKIEAPATSSPQVGSPQLGAPPMRATQATAEPAAVRPAGDTPARPATAEPKQVPILLPTDSLRDIELQIAEYLRAKTNWEIDVQSKTNKPEDLYLSILFAAENIPSNRITVDTFVSEIEKSTNKVVEQVVKVRGYAFDSKDRRILNRARFYEVANRWTASFWVPQRLYADSEGDLILEWHVNLTPDGGVHAEQIHDAIIKMSETWKDMVPALKKASVIQ